MEIRSKINKTEEELDVEIKNIFRSLEFKSYYKGYGMWITAILYVASSVNKGETNIKMMNVYKFVSKKYHSSLYQAERDMRYVLEKAGKERLKEIFNVSYKISNISFLNLIIEKITNQNDNYC